MNEFMMIFRHAGTDASYQMSPEEMQASIKEWQDWIGGIAAQGKFSGTNMLVPATGKVLKPGNLVSDGPYVELKEAVGGYLIAQAADMDEALQLAQGCPILSIGGNVEVRPIANLNG